MREQLRKKREEGFTLIELLIVIIILAILAAIVVFAVGSTTTNAKVASCDANAKSIETALEAYKAQAGGYPATLNSLTTESIIGGQSVGPWLRGLSTGGTAADGYAISYDGAGGVYVETDGGASANYDVSDLCSQA